MGLSFNIAKKLLIPAIVLGVITLPLNAADKRPGDIRNTKHNLSAQSSNTTRANSETEVCVFCHTPHGANTTAPGAPLWNRQLNPGASYALYSSASLDAAASVGQPSGQSKLCLSCHDGTLAINAVGNMAGSGSGSNYIQMSGQSDNLTPFTMPDGEGTNTGFTRNLGTDLSNDHPISFPYSTALAQADGELRDPADEANSHIGNASPGIRPTYPLTNGDLQCTSCHDPHVKGTDNPNNTADVGNNAKFLRGPRFQISDPLTSGTDFVPGIFDETSGNATSGDIVCLACHDRELNAQVWANSGHANPNIADETYTDTAANQREFPTGIKVWQASCLNCHDTHTVAGSRRLLREGTDSTASPKTGGKAAIEETCYQCHTGGSFGTSILNSGTGSVPNIQGEFEGIGKRRMPITTGDQRTTTQTGGNDIEEHEITDADLSESADALGKTFDYKRHAECTDCHNPHRLIRNSRFNADGVKEDTGDDPTSLRTHQTGLNDTSGTNRNDGREGNIASGVLRGIWGLEPIIPGTLSDKWPEPDLTYTIKKGDPSASDAPYTDSTRVDSPHLTREYQLCFKCHSNYSLTMSPTTSPVSTVNLGGHTGGTPSGTNTMTHYTNVAAEFASVKATLPATTGGDQGENHGGTGNNRGTACAATATTGNEATGSDCEPSPSYPGGNGYNHRSWHPVMFPTGRDREERSINTTGTTVNFKAPWADNIGTQTMHCSDCHGGETSYEIGVGATSGVQGPHGSTNNFLLKGETANPTNFWTRTAAINGGTALINAPDYGFCGNCHQPKVGNNASGFGTTDSHVPDTGNMGGGSCMNCHIAVPHGWKNKAFLVNLLCVGSEVPSRPDTNSECASAGGYPAGDAYDPRTYAPYYNDARLRVENWARSGEWQYASCGVNKTMEDGCPKTN